MEERKIAFERELSEKFHEQYNKCMEEDEREAKKMNDEYERSFWIFCPDTRKTSQVIMNKPRNLVRKVIR